jgi:hypothetical protein
MSQDYSNIEDANFSFGNSDTILADLKAKLIADLNPNLTADLTDDTASKICTKQYARQIAENKIYNFSTANGIYANQTVNWSSNGAGIHIFPPDSLRVSGLATLDNSVVRKKYVDDQCSLKQNILTSSSNISTNNISSSGNINLISGKNLGLVNGSSILCNGITNIYPYQLAYLDGVSSSIQNQLDTKSSISYVDTKISDLVGTAPNLLNTLQEISNSLNDDPNVFTTLSNNISLKQDLLTNGSIGDSLLASTFVKESTAPFLTGTNITDIPQSSITNLTTDLAGKQSILTNGSVGDSLLSSVFVKTSTNQTITGIKSFGQIVVSNISELFSAVSTGTNSFVLNYSSGSVFYLTTGSTLSANFSVSLQNILTDTDRSRTITLIYATTGKWYCNSITAWSDSGSTQITLSSSTPLFSGGNPSITTSTVMVQTFNIIRIFGSNYCLSNVSSFY